MPRLMSFVHIHHSRSIGSVDKNVWLESLSADQMLLSALCEQKQLYGRTRHRWTVGSVTPSNRAFLESHFFRRRGWLLRGNIQRLTLENLILGCDCRPKRFV